MSADALSPRALQARLAATLLIAVMLGMIGVSWATLHAFDAGLRPQLRREAAVVGASVGELVSRALEHGIALPELVGANEQLDEVRRQHPELAYLALKDGVSTTLFESGKPEQVPGIEVPILRQGQPGQQGLRVGAVEAQVSAAYIQHILFESAIDLGVVFIVAMFLTRELLHAIASADTGLGSAATGSPDANHRMLAKLRVPLFLFMLAEELTRAFLPAYSRALMPADMPSHWHLSPEILVGLPIVVFMAVVALGQPILASWSERTGHRRIMLWGAALGVAGLAGAALASGIVNLIAWRSLCGLGYAMVFVAGQGFVIDHTTPSGRTAGFALFVGAIMVAAVCGPPIGGMLADHVGPRWGFAVAAAIAGVAWLAVRSLPREGAGASSVANKTPAPRDFMHLFAQGRFMWVTMLAAFPAKLMLAGMCFYLVPLYVVAQGAPPSVAGRAMMIYAVVLVLVMPQTTRWVERGVPLARLVGLGLCISSLGGCALIAWQGLAPIYLVMALLGLGQGLSIAAQSSLLAQVCAAEISAYGNGPVFGVYRLVERLGNTCGPLIAGLLAATMGQAHAFVAIAAVGLSCGLLFLLLARGVGART